MHTPLSPEPHQRLAASLVRLREHFENRLSTTKMIVDGAPFAAAPDGQRFFAALEALLNDLDRSVFVELNLATALLNGDTLLAGTAETVGDVLCEQQLFALDAAGAFLDEHMEK